MPDLIPGLYDEVVTHALARALDDDRWHSELAELDPDAASEVLARHLYRFLRNTLAALRGTDKLERQVRLANRLLEALAAEDDDQVDADDRVTAARLLEVVAAADKRLGSGRLQRPSIPLRHSDLIVNGPRDLRVGREIQLELASADRVDVLISFVMWTGFVEIRDALRAFVDRHEGRPAIRVLTTTYMAATDPRALDALRELGAEVRVNYDGRRTRLHAKAWLFHRASGFSTGIIGSSNLSQAALRDGCEWNVRLSNVDNAAILGKFEATFEQYWDDPAYEAYDHDRFIRVLAAKRNPERDALASAVRLHPYPHQATVLDALMAERDAGHTCNLVVAATGTGKTVIAALDYKALCKKLGRRPTLLFVAHRHEILQKSRATYRAALSDGSFGELRSGREAPVVGRHVFASIQSLHARRLRELQPGAYDVVVVDEFHHAEAATYRALLEQLAPTYLLGLTATPERTDGRSILHWFDHRIAAESRLWDALDQDLLVPFQYFGVSDGTDLSQIDFRGGRYDIASLEAVYTADEHRAQAVLRAVVDRVRDPTTMRALGFCVSVRHAEFMAAFFVAQGLRAVAVTGRTPRDARARAMADLRSGALCALFTVDLFNEGVDIPAVDTVLFLRPTESATLYLQQLGRGLRLHEGKSCLTVLDFIGRANRRFRFDRRFRAMLGGGTRAEVRDAVADGFPRLPSGCAIQLDETAREVVLDNIRRTLSNWVSLADDLVEDWPLSTFLDRADVSLPELYRSGRCFTQLRAHRGFVADAPDTAITRALPRLLHVDDPARLARWRRWLASDTPPAADLDDPYQRMLFAALGQPRRPLAELGDFLAELWSDAAVLGEVRQLLALLDDRRRLPTHALPRLPFHVHGTYSRDEISAGLGELRKGKLLRTQSGVLRCEAHRCDVLYVTLDKDEQDFTPTTLYNDYPMSQRRFHWESQGTTRLESPTGKRYRQPPPGWRILLFVRRAKRDARKLTMPYLFLGPVRCFSATGERPIQIVWELERQMPAGWFAEVKIAAG
jgi:superfamily II DNA or RNA helicase/HKD family nuclease